MDPKKVRKIWQLIEWCILIYSSWGNQINHQKHDNLLYEAHGLKQLQVAFHHHKVLHLLRIQPGPLGSDHIAGDGKDPLRFRWSSWHWEDHLELGKKGELCLVMLPPSQLVHGGQLVRQQLERLRFTICGRPWTSSAPPSPCPRTPSCDVPAGGFSRLWWILGKPWWPRLNLRKGIFINKWWFVGVTFGWVILAQKTLCNGAIQIVSQVSPNFGCLFLQNNAVLLDGGHGYRLQRWICSAYISILSQHYLNNKTFIC